MYYIAKVKVVVDDANGKPKKATEQYLVRGVSVTDVETKIHDEFKDSVVDFEVSAVTQTKVIKVIE